MITYIAFDRQRVLTRGALAKGRNTLSIELFDTSVIPIVEQQEEGL